MILTQGKSDKWDEATATLTPELADNLPKLKLLLESCDLELAKILTGRSGSLTASKEDARELEKVLLGVLSEKDDIGEASEEQQKPHKNSGTVVAWLRILFVAIKWFNSHGFKLTTMRLPAIPLPERSPFSQSRVEKIAIVGYWRKALFKGIKEGCHKQAVGDTIALIALSSILCGCLLEKRKVLMLVNSLPKQVELAGSLAFINFNLPYQGNPDAQLQRWFIDPSTEMLLATATLPASSNNISEKSLNNLVLKFLINNGCENNQCPSSLSELIDSASVYWESRSARVDIQFMRRRFLSHSLTCETWLRINHCDETAPFNHQGSVGTIKQIGDRFEDDSGSGDENLVLDSVSCIGWYQQISKAMKSKQPCVVTAKLSELKTQHVDDSAATYLGWLDKLMHGTSSSNTKLADSTIFRQFKLITPLMISLIGEENPKEWSLDDLKAVYQFLLVDYAGKCSRSDLSKGLREFQHFLSDNNKNLRLKETRDLLGDEAVLSPVEARVITFDEYESAKNLLRSKELTEEKDRIDAALLILILTFRLGLRRSEAFMLLLNDFHMNGNPVLLVRPHMERRLKSHNSKRSIPLRPFLSRDEMKFLREYLERREFQEKAKPFSSFVFAMPRLGRAIIPIEATVDLIHECIRKVTGDETLHLHHLRHSFGTWTYLKLRAPDHACIREVFSHLPHTYRYLSQGNRLRVLLLGSGVNPVRGYAFAVARLLGHSGPNVSMEHYVHCNDLVAWANSVRDFENSVDRGAVVTLSPLKQSGTYEYHANNVHMLLAATRKAFSSRYQIHQKSSHTSTPIKVKNLRGRPKNNSAAPKVPNWIALRKVRNILHLVAQSKTVEEIAEILVLPKPFVHATLTRAELNQERIGLKPDLTGKVVCPAFPRLTDDIDFFEDIESRLEKLAESNRELFSKGIENFLVHYNVKQGDVVFRGSKDVTKAKQYVQFIRELGIHDNRIRLVVRAMQTGKHDLTLWQEHLGLSQATPKFVNADFANHPAYGKWIGIQVLDNYGKGHHKAFALAIYLSSII